MVAESKFHTQDLQNMSHLSPLQQSGILYLVQQNL